jgi:hypothetical protein
VWFLRKVFLVFNTYDTHDTQKRCHPPSAHAHLRSNHKTRTKMTKRTMVSIPTLSLR